MLTGSLECVSIYGTGKVSLYEPCHGSRLISREKELPIHWQQFYP